MNTDVNHLRKAHRDELKKKLSYDLSAIPEPQDTNDLKLFEEWNFVRQVNEIFHQRLFILERYEKSRSIKADLLDLLEGELNQVRWEIELQITDSVIKIKKEGEGEVREEKVHEIAKLRQDIVVLRTIDDYEEIMSSCMNYKFPMMLAHLKGLIQYEKYLRQRIDNEEEYRELFAVSKINQRENPYELNQQVLIMHYFGMLDDKRGLPDYKFAKIVAAIINRSIQNVRTTLRFTRYNYKKDEKKSEHDPKTYKDLMILKQFFNDLGLEEYEQKVDSNLEYFNKKE